MKKDQKTQDIDPAVAYVHGFLTPEISLKSEWLERLYPAAADFLDLQRRLCDETEKATMAIDEARKLLDQDRALLADRLEQERISRAALAKGESALFDKSMATTKQIQEAREKLAEQRRAILDSDLFNNLRPRLREIGREAVQAALQVREFARITTRIADAIFVTDNGAQSHAAELIRQRDGMLSPLTERLDHRGEKKVKMTIYGHNTGKTNTRKEYVTGNECPVCGNEVKMVQYGERKCPKCGSVWKLENVA